MVQGLLIRGSSCRARTTRRGGRLSALAVAIVLLPRWLDSAAVVCRNVLPERFPGPGGRTIVDPARRVGRSRGDDLTAGRGPRRAARRSRDSICHGFGSTRLRDDVAGAATKTFIIGIRSRTPARNYVYLRAETSRGRARLLSGSRRFRGDQCCSPAIRSSNRSPLTTARGAGSSRRSDDPHQDEMLVAVTLMAGEAAIADQIGTPGLTGPPDRSPCGDDHRAKHKRITSHSWTTPVWRTVSRARFSFGCQGRSAASADACRASAR